MQIWSTRESATTRGSQLILSCITSTPTGQTNLTDWSDRFLQEDYVDPETRAPEGPVGTNEARVTLRSAGHLERPQMQ